MIKKTRGFSLVLVGLFALFASGCIETSMQFQGNPVSPAMSVVKVQRGASNAGTWKTFELTIDYKYLQSSDNFEISGQAVLSQHYQGSYLFLRSLDVYMFFLDENTRVLKTARLARASTGAIDEVLGFSQHFTLPAGTVGISFGYDGVVTELNDVSSFYELPLSKK